MMITDVLADLILKVEDNTSTHVKVHLNNIATLKEHDTPVETSSAIVLSIVNIEEDKTLKNQSLYQKYQPGSNTVKRFHKPAQNLIISLLFSSYDKENTKYEDGLKRLEEVIRYFQNENVFYYYNGQLNIAPPATEEEKEESTKIILDMVSLKTDQVNQLWSYLGSRYMPSVVYSMRMIRIQKEDIINQPIVKEVELELWRDNKDDPSGELETKEVIK
ncbi:DUF4255 domain-containing protein [Flavobacterium sp.]|uniref:DUF4255 domain-containing protein n=1 Tax=Flavobacterium sp. TaxID=239 RepID=UPI0026144E73|nr:DUF4255 domain-containing protein [Flavobacterium sp.]